jgi:IMP dehydrogenase
MGKVSDQIGLTYDDVLLRPGRSEIRPSETSLKTFFSRRIPLNIPLASAAMDTVTESGTAIAMAQRGGIGVIHKNMTKEDQASQVRRVKKFESGVILDPVTVSPEDTIERVRELTQKHAITGVPVVGPYKVLVGILTRRDLQFEEDGNKRVQEVMTPMSRLICANLGVSLDEARRLLHEHRIEKLPLINEENQLQGLMTIKDITKETEFPDACKDQLGRLRVAAAIGVGEEEKERAALLVEEGVDALVIDTAHGHSQGVMEMARLMVDLYQSQGVDILAGNVATKEAALDLVECGLDGVKVGIGPGSICTTRIIAGIGVPQLSAILECSEVLKEKGVSLIADGGIKYSGDLVKALAAGATTVMIGSLFAGCDETPGESILYRGRAYKSYRGMGSLGAMPLGSKDRYGQGSVDEVSKLVPEGVEGQVPSRGPLADNIYQLLGGLKAGLGYVGAENLDQLFEKAVFQRITAASMRESHPHDVMVTKETPNYSHSRGN